MENGEFFRLVPDLQTIAAQFPGCSWQCAHTERVYRSVQLYTGGETPEEDILYLIRQGDGFPVEERPWLSADRITGRADHICCPGRSREELLDTLLALYARLREQERRLDTLLYQNADLQQLCQLGEELLGNPVYLHDDWFIIVAQSARVEAHLEAEHVMSSGKSFLPRALIDDFQTDSDYLETYAYRSPQLWRSARGRSCLYVNLWDGAVYRGRLLVLETDRPIRHGDYQLARLLAQGALQLMRRKQPGGQPGRSLDDIMYQLLQGSQPEAADLTLLLNMLKWGKTDKLLCVRVQSQQSEESALMKHTLHSDLFQSFPGGYILFTESQQCVILNLSKNELPYPQLRHLLSPLCRDYCLYAGVSSPVMGVRELHLGYYQAEMALNQAFRLQNEKWILSFPECALEHLVDHLDSPLQPLHLVSPDLRRLMEWDEKNGTAYFATLREYLLQERDIPRTSEKLIIHRTTLLYRLKKIRSLIFANLDDPWQRLYLTLSLWILEREKPPIPDDYRPSG